MNREYLSQFDVKNRRQIKAISELLRSGDDAARVECFDFLLGELFYFLARNGVGWEDMNRIMVRGGTFPSTKKVSMVQRLFKEDCKSLQDYCSFCGCKEDLTSHHVFRQSEHPYLKYNPNYIIRLCRDCHEHFHQYRDTGKGERLLRVIKGVR